MRQYFSQPCSIGVNAAYSALGLAREVLGGNEAGNGEGDEGGLHCGRLQAETWIGNIHGVLGTASKARRVERCERQRDRKGKGEGWDDRPALLFVVGGDGGSWSALSASRVVPPTGLRGLMS